MPAWIFDYKTISNTYQYDKEKDLIKKQNGIMIKTENDIKREQEVLKWQRI